jgi:hypothetical protein
MNLGQKISVVGLLSCLILISCSERNSLEQDFLLEVSDRKELLIGDGGLTSEPTYFVSLDSSRSKGVIYNSKAHSLDSIFLSSDYAWVKDGDILETEGPYGVGTVFSFFTTQANVVYLNGQEFFRQDILDKEVSRKFMHEYGIFGESKYPAISVPTFKVSHEFNGLDKNTLTAYFVYESERNIQVAGFDSFLDSMYFLPVSLDSVSYFETRFKVKSGNLILGLNDEPQLTVNGSQLIVSYPTFSDILVYDLKARTQRTHAFTSSSFLSKRILPTNYADEVGSFEQLHELENVCRNQVRFGVVTYLGNVNKYVRLVKGEGADASYFLEVFDSDFQRLQEFNLTAINPDLSADYLNSKYGLMFRAKDQPAEDVMYYYNLNLIKKK